MDTETSCPLVFDRYLDEDSVQMFESLNVMHRNELQARNEVKSGKSTRRKYRLRRACWATSA